MTLVEFFDCYTTFTVEGTGNTPGVVCPACRSNNTMRYLNERTAALDAALGDP